MTLLQKLKRIYSRLFKGAFAKNVTIVAGGTALTQLLVFLLSPIVTRLYSPEEFGVLSLYSAVLSMIAIAASLKYEWSIPIAESDEKVINIVALSFSILCITSILITSLLVIPEKDIIIRIIGLELYPYRLFLPMGVLFTGLYNILLQIGYRDRAYKVIAKTKLSQVITGESVRIGFGFFSVGPIGLILGSILKISAGSISLIKNIIKIDKYRICDISWNQIKIIAKRYRDFPVFSAPSQILNTAGLNLPKIFLASLYGIEVVGAFGFASSVISLPVLLVGNSVADVFYGEAAKLRYSDPKRLKVLSLLLFKKLLLIGFLPFITLVFFGPLIFSIVFGNRWEIAGRYAQILSFLVYARLVFIPFSRIFSIYEKQNIALLLDIFRVIVVVIVFILCKFLGYNELLAIILYTISMFLVYVTTFIMVQLMMTKALNKPTINTKVEP